MQWSDKCLDTWQNTIRISKIECSCPYSGLGGVLGLCLWSLVYHPDVTIVRWAQLWRSVSVFFSIHLLTHAHCAQCSLSISLWLASQVLAPSGGRTESPDHSLRIPVSHDRQRVCLSLRVEFLLKTYSAYSKDKGDTLFTLATPGNALRSNTHRSAPPVCALTHSRGPRKRSPSPVDMLEHRDKYGQA